MYSQIQALEVAILSIPTGDETGLGAILDDVVDLLWDTSPGAMDRFTAAAVDVLQAVHEAYALR